MKFEIKRLKNNYSSIIKDLEKIEKEAFGEGGLDYWGLMPLVYHGAVYVVMINNQAVGVVEYMQDMNKTDSVYLYGLAIAKDYQKRGLGADLLDYSLRELKKEGFKEVELTVAPDNETAINLYETFAFKKVQYRQDEYGVGQDRVIMKLDL